MQELSARTVERHPVSTVRRDGNRAALRYHRDSESQTMTSQEEATKIGQASNNRVGGDDAEITFEIDYRWRACELVGTRFSGGQLSTAAYDGLQQAAGMTGDARKAFMASCLSNKPSEAAKPPDCKPAKSKPSG